MKLAALALIGLIAGTASQAATLSYSVDLSRTTHTGIDSISGTYTIDTEARRLIGFDLVLRAAGGTIDPAGYAGTLRSVDGPELPFAEGISSLDTKQAGQYYQGRISDGQYLLSGGSSYTLPAGYPAWTDATLLELNQFSGPLTTLTYPVVPWQPNAPQTSASAPLYRDYLSLSGSDLFSGGATQTLGYGFCRQTFLVRPVYQPFDNAFFNQASYNNTACAGLSGTATRIALVNYDADPGDAPAVPVPASLPLLLGGIGLIAALRRRKAA